MGAGQVEIVAQKIAQQQPRLDGASVRNAVDGEGDGVFHGMSSLIEVISDQLSVISNQWTHPTDN
jgi:hypothetical protein